MGKKKSKPVGNIVKSGDTWYHIHVDRTAKPLLPPCVHHAINSVPDSTCEYYRRYLVDVFEQMANDMSRVLYARDHIIPIEYAKYCYDNWDAQVGSTEYRRRIGASKNRPVSFIMKICRRYWEAQADGSLELPF